MYSLGWQLRTPLIAFEPRASGSTATPSDQTCARAQKWTSTEHKQWPPRVMFNECNAEGPRFSCWWFLDLQSEETSIEHALCFFYSWNLYNDDFQKESPLPGIARIDFHLVFWGVSLSCLSTCRTQIFSVVSVPFSANIWLAMNFVHHWSTQWASLLMLLLKDRLQDSTMTLWINQSIKHLTLQSISQPFNQSTMEAENHPISQATYTYEAYLADFFAWASPRLVSQPVAPLSRPQPLGPPRFRAVSDRAWWPSQVPGNSASHKSVRNSQDAAPPGPWMGAMNQ